MEKEILQAIKELSVQMNEMEARQAKEFNVIRGEISGIKGEINGIKGEMNGIKDEINGIKGEMNGIKGEMKDMEERLSKKIESEVRFLNKSMEMVIKSNHDNQVEIKLLKDHVYR